MAHSPTGPAPNHLIRSRFTPPDRATFEPASLRVVLKPLNMRASYIRTKMPVVRLCQRRLAPESRKTTQNLASGQLPWFGRKAANARILRH